MSARNVRVEAAHCEGVFLLLFSPSSFLLPVTKIYYVLLYGTLPLADFEFRCAVHSSALIDGVFRLHWGSARTVAAQFSIGLTEHRHRQSSAVRSTVVRRGRRQDNVRSVVDGLHRSSSAEAELACSDHVRQCAVVLRFICRCRVHLCAPRRRRSLTCARWALSASLAVGSPT